jgi:hypothetical protein
MQSRVMQGHERGSAGKPSRSIADTCKSAERPSTSVAMDTALETMSAPLQFLSGKIPNQALLTSEAVAKQSLRTRARLSSDCLLRSFSVSGGSDLIAQSALSYDLRPLT